jgi:hypothetical protein
MKQYLKDLLLKDLCARLPYGVKAVLKQTNCHDSTKHKVNEKDIYSFRTGRSLEEDYGQHDYYKVIVTDIKPYLFPLSSMTEEQKEELENLGWYFDNFEIHNVSECLGAYREYVAHSDCFALIDWLNKNHFDYRNLINKNLAIDCTNLEIYK